MQQERSPSPVVISGPSGVGKGTLIKMVLNQLPNKFALTVSHTTRQPRPGEVEGSTYYYRSEAEFLSHVARDGFLEYTHHGGNYYGTSRWAMAEQAEKGRRVLMEIDVEGVKQLKEKAGFEALYIFIKPLSFGVLETRLRNRQTENEAEVNKRLAQAKVELEYVETSDAFGAVIVNDDLTTAYTELVGILLRR